MNNDEVCLTCERPRGEHLRQHLNWMSRNAAGVLVAVDFWQDDICPWMHNMTQAPWDIYLFRGKDWYAKSNKPDWIED